MIPRALSLAIVALTAAAAPVLFAGEPRSEWTTDPASWSSGTYRYDGAGNVHEIGTDTYRYDALGRLVRATAATPGNATNQQDFQYDDYGNLTFVTTKTAAGTMVGGFAVNESTNQLTGPCPTGVQACHQGVYDPAGSGHQVGLASPGQYRWDALGTMSELNSLRHERYVYDANDERVLVIDYLATSESQRRYTPRGLDSKVTRELTHIPSTDTWLPVKDYVYRGGMLMASFSTPATEPDRHYHLDHLGSTRLVTDSAGRRLAAHTYWPFGREAAGSDTDTERLKFTGHERDGSGSTSGFELDYMLARYGDPALGRFLTVDPSADSVNMTLPQSWNRYAYARNNPLICIDPTGAVVQFASTLAQNYYDDYRKELDVNSQDYKNLVQLENSNITYVIKVNDLNGEKEGEVTFDGNRVFLNLASGGPTQDASMQSRMAHEIQHGVQVDDGALGFRKGPDGKWTVNFTDIQDEVQAWDAQVRQATDADYFSGNLRDYTKAKDKVDFLIRHGYPQYDNRRNDVSFAPKVPGMAPGSLMNSSNSFYRIRP